MKLPVYILVTCYLLLVTCHGNAQELYYQNTFKGGVSFDGVTYVNSNWIQSDTIHFQNSVPAGCTLKKAFLIGLKESCANSIHPNSDIPLSLLYNNKTIQFDSLDNATPIFFSQMANPYATMYMCVKDVTALTQNSNNVLVTPFQQYGANECDYYDYDGFYLLLLYENSSFSTVNVVLYLNDMTYTPVMNYILNNLNPINTTQDVALSIETAGNNVAPYLQYQLNSLANTYTLGTIQIINHGIDYKTGLGSFYYQNGTLTGLVDDVNSPFIDSTDALCNIKTYLPNNSSSFSLTTTTANAFDNNWTTGFVMAYSTPCPALPASIDSTRQYAVCTTGLGVQINASPGYKNYSWVPATGLSSTTTASPIAKPATGANKYICYVADAQGCMHTEYFTVNSYATPTATASSSAAVCGGTNGIATIDVAGTNFGAYTYTYTLNGAVQSSNIFDLPAGVYSYSVANNFGCNQQGIQSFTITEVNNAQAAFTAQPDTGCAPENIVFTNNSTNTNAQVWYINGDSTNAINPNYTFTDSGVYTITLLSWYNQRQCSSTVSHTVSLKDCPPPPPVPADSISISVPNIFTPNADGINDTWQVEIYTRGYTISNFQCTIYDRWGIQVFDSNTSLSGRTGGVAWTGRTTSGESATAGSYFYLIKLTQINSKGVSENKEFKGYLELIR